MSKIKKLPAQSARAKARSVERLSAMIEREVQRRLGANSTFEQRNNMRAEIIKEAAFRGADDDLQGMTTDDEEVEEEDGRYRRLDQASSATYFGRWGPHRIAEPLFRKVGVRNGPTIKPIERRAGIIENMTPDMACIVGGLGADHSSREVERTLWRTGIVAPSRAFLEKRGSQLALDVATKVVELETAARSQAVPAPAGAPARRGGQAPGCLGRIPAGHAGTLPGQRLSRSAHQRSEHPGQAHAGARHFRVGVRLADARGTLASDTSAR